MAWHSFEDGSTYSRPEIIDACTRQLNQVKDLEGKQAILILLAKHAPSQLRWSPHGSGWGRSPFNPNCWKTLDGGPAIAADITIPKVLAEE